MIMIDNDILTSPAEVPDHPPRQPGVFLQSPSFTAPLTQGVVEAITRWVSRSLDGHYVSERTHCEEFRQVVARIKNLDEQLAAALAGLTGDDEQAGWL